MSRDVPPGAQNHACFILRPLKCLLAAFRFHLKSQTETDAPHLEVRVERDDDEIILVLPQHGADSLDGPNHDEFLIAGANRLSNRISAREELLHQAIADQANRNDMVIFKIGEVPAQYQSSRV